MDTKIYIKFLILLCSTYNIINALLITSKQGCASSIPCSNITVSNTTTTTTITTKPNTPSTQPTSPKPICLNCPSKDCSMVPDGTTFPYANHCRLFYMCVAGSAEICTCSSGEWYDRNITKCAKCELVTNCMANTD